MIKKLKKLFLKKRHLLKNSVGLRLSIYKSNNHIYSQIINDEKHETVLSCSTVEKEIKTIITSTNTCKGAFFIGTELAKRAQQKEIYKVKFNRNKKRYQGRIKSLIEGARLNGLII
jgi:large subunit ribosomal protein L18